MKDHPRPHHPRRRRLPPLPHFHRHRHPRRLHPRRLRELDPVLQQALHQSRLQPLQQIRLRLLQAPLGLLGSQDQYQILLG